MPQVATPSADTVRTAWTDQAGGTVNIYTTVDEASPGSDADYIKTAAPPGANEYETLLTSVTDPLSSSNHTIYWRRRAQPGSGGAVINLTVRLLEGVTQITSQADNSIPSAFTTTSYTLSAAEADSITDYTNLRVEIVATQV